MPGSAFDTSGPPDGDYARYLERLSGDDAQRGSASGSRGSRGSSGSGGITGRGRIGAPPSAEHRWGHAAADDGIEHRGSGLDACPGPEPGFGYGPAGTPAAGSATIPSAVGKTPPRPRSALHVLALVLILAGVAVIALAALPPEPWFSTPLPGFLLLVAGLHLRRVARRGRRTDR